MLKIVINILSFLFTCMIFCAGIVTYLFYLYSQDLPDFSQLSEYNPPAASRLYSYDGTLIEQYAQENRIYVHYSEIPQTLIDAFIAAEDKNFFIHSGIDPTSIFRAIIQNIISLGRAKSLKGGSTITQQVVKNFLLTNEQSFSRKIKEAILSFRITQSYSKERILELYLNQIYLGNSAYGVVSASLIYFGKSLEELTIAEAAFLAGLPKAPSNYDPKKNYDKALARRNYVINRMFEDSYINKESARSNISTPLTITQKAPDLFAKSANYFAETVRQQIVNQFSEDLLYTGGLTIRTTLNNKLQIAADRIFKEALINFDRQKSYRGVIGNLAGVSDPLEELKQYHKTVFTGNYKLALITEVRKDKANITFEDGSQSHLDLTHAKWAQANLSDLTKLFKKNDVILVELKNNHYELAQIPQISGGLVAMEVKTGRVLAMVGGYDFRASKFNRVTQANRQPGSVFKPFVYLSALENNFQPNYILDDSPLSISQGAGMPMWTPKNYKNDYLGNITLRTALEKSRNIATIKLAQKIGIENIVEITSRFGINPKPQKNFATVLGASETTLLDMTNAYAIVANKGEFVKPSVIEYVKNLSGDVIYKKFQGVCENCNITGKDAGYPILLEKKLAITDPASAYQLTSILEGVTERGTGRQAKVLGPYIAGKTGTTNDSKDVWYIGYTSDIVVGIYMGYDQPKSLGKATGATLALPVFVKFMQEALKLYPAKAFDIPEGIILRPVNQYNGSINVSNTPNNGIIYEAFKFNNDNIAEPDAKFTNQDGEILLDDNIINLDDNLNEDMDEKQDDMSLEGIY